MEPLPCPNCGSTLTLLEQYRRHFCYRCGQYAPDGYGEQGPRKCANCAGILSYVASYGRFYCYRCNAYASGERLGSQPEVDSRSAPQIVESRAEDRSPTGEVSPAPLRAAPLDSPGTTGRAARQVGSETEEETPDEAPPELTREFIRDAKKSQLLDACRAYGLEPSGTKEQIRERLLSYLEEQRAKPQGSDTSEDETPTDVPPVPGAVEPVEHALPPEERVEAADSDRGSIVLIEETLPQDPAAVSSGEGTVSPVEPITEPLEIAKDAPSAGEAGADLGPVPVSAPPRIEHPCPTCGRELDFIEQYGRYYCHSCKTYAPATSFRHACPTCGAILRWIDRYARWWCDQEQRYAPADLPPPSHAAARGGGVASVATTGTVPRATEEPTIPAHRHRNPTPAIGVAAVGLIMWATFEAAVEIPQVMGTQPPIALSPEVGFLLRFLGFLFLGVGVLVGLASVRHRP